MKIFITIPWFVPAFRAGGPIQSIANLIENFNENVEYYIFCGNTDINGELMNGIITEEWTSYNNFTKVWYASKKNLTDTIIKEVKICKPDVLFIIGLFNWHYNIVPILFCKVPTKIISIRGMLHPGALLQKKWKKRIFLFLFKCNKKGKHIFHATNIKEAEYIFQQFGKNCTIKIAGNFLKNMDISNPTLKTNQILKLITIALISPMKNHLLVLQSLKKCTASISYDIYGAIKDFNYWQQCLVIIKSMPANIQVQYHGELLPELISVALSTQHVFIMPSKSENFGHAIGEALASGKPVITSNYTPWNDLTKYNAGLNVELSIVEITNAINFFVRQDQIVYNKFSLAAIDYVKKHLNTTANKTAYHQMFSNNNTHAV